MRFCARLRFGTAALGLLAAALAALPAKAADPAERWAPDVGTVLEYHVRTNVKPAGKPASLQESTLRKTVTSNDGTRAEYSNVVRIAGVPDGSPEGETYAGTNRYDLFLATETRFVRLFPTRTLLTSYRCDEAALRGLLPLGKVPAVTVPCTVAMEVQPGQRQEQDVSVTFAFEGRTAVRVPAGTFDAAGIRTRSTFGTMTTDNLVQVDTATGVLVRQSVTVAGPTASSTVTELTGINRRSP